MRSTVVVLIGVFATAAAFGCSQVLGVDFDQAHARLDGDASAGADGKVQVDPNDEAGVGEVPDATPIGCAADEKTCNGVCVKKSDPLHGCGTASCTPCSLVNASEAACDANGQCKVGKCAAGHADCNGKADDGCEADLTSPATCTSCTTQCAQSTPLCGPAGCTASCPSPTVACGSSCVDTSKSPDHCGGCGKKCANVNNAAPVCTSSSCGIACNAGFGDCNGNPLDGCEPLKQWFLDGDGDKIGGTTTQMACNAPGATWVQVGGDCHDGNPQVFPGQTGFFTTGYTSAAGTESFDYDCNGAEQEQGTPDHFVGGCGVACDNLGYVVRSPARSGTGVDNYCGSATYRECVTTGIPVLQPGYLPPGGGSGCSATNTPGMPTIACH